MRRRKRRKIGILGRESASVSRVCVRNWAESERNARIVVCRLQKDDPRALLQKLHIEEVRAKHSRGFFPVRPFGREAYLSADGGICSIEPE